MAKIKRAVQAEEALFKMLKAFSSMSQNSHATQIRLYAPKELNRINELQEISKDLINGFEKFSKTLEVAIKKTKSPIAKPHIKNVSDEYQPLKEIDVLTTLKKINAVLSSSSKEVQVYLDFYSSRPKLVNGQDAFPEAESFFEKRDFGRSPADKIINIGLHKVYLSCDRSIKKTHQLLERHSNLLPEQLKGISLKALSSRIDRVNKEEKAAKK
ncbi:hypothetical protein [Bdellovibrio sp. HCB337]|uniref:hypothetical protein n=1 Tax=Bdellovibrio sp. HCB337 TaxID=3394358 RepID=UPI0039A43179